MSEYERESLRTAGVGKDMGKAGEGQNWIGRGEEQPWGWVGLVVALTVAP